MASDKTIHPLALESLFGPAGIAADENGDGYPDVVSSQYGKMYMTYNVGP